MAGDKRPSSKHIILATCVTIFAELHQLRDELEQVMASSTILLRVVNGLRYTLTSNVEDMMLGAATQIPHNMSDDMTMTAQQALEAVKCCRSMSVAVLVKDRYWNVELEKSLLKQWKHFVGLLFILSQSLPLERSISVLPMLDIQPPTVSPPVSSYGRPAKLHKKAGHVSRTASCMDGHDSTTPNMAARDDAHTSSTTTSMPQRVHVEWTKPQIEQRMAWRRSSIASFFSSRSRVVNLFASNDKSPEDPSTYEEAETAKCEETEQEKTSLL